MVTANGRTVHVPGKTDVSVPNVKRLEGKKPLIKSFEDEQRRIRGIAQGRGSNKKREYLSLRRSSTEDVIKVVCPEIHTSMAALDVVGQLHGTNNFKIMRTKLMQLEALTPALTVEIHKVRSAIRSAEDILSNKDMFRSSGHFGCPIDNSGPAIHCHYFAFGLVDPTPLEPVVGREMMACCHYHSGGCEVCGQMKIWLSYLRTCQRKLKQEMSQRRRQ